MTDKPYVPIGKTEQKIFAAGAHAQQGGAQIKDCPYSGQHAYVWIAGWTWSEANG